LKNLKIKHNIFASFKERSLYIIHGEIATITINVKEIKYKKYILITF